MALEADPLGIHGFVALKIIQRTARAPGPRAQYAPIIGLTRLTLVDQTDNALRQALSVIGLNAACRELRVAPPFRQNLLLPCGTRGCGFRSARGSWSRTEFHNHRHWTR